MKRKPRILVLGGLAAGPSAASKAKRVNNDAEVILFERTKFISYGICEIPYYLTGEYKDKTNLVVYSPDRLQKEKNVVVHTETEVESIDRKNKAIQVKDLKRGVRRKEEYDKLIIATGSTPRQLDFVDRPISNLFTVKELARAYELEQYLKKHKPKRAVVIGAGYIGIEMAEALHHLGIDVTLIHRHSFPLSKIDERSGKLLTTVLRESGIHFVPDTMVKSIGKADDGTVKTVVTDNGVFDANLVISAIGVVPNVTIAKEAGLRTGQLGGIKTDERQCTNDDSVFAAGDCCEVRNLISRRPAYLPLATVASKMARTAGENAAGGSSVFKGAIRNIALRLFDYEVSRVGLTMDEAEEAGYKVVIETIEAPSRVVGMPGAARLTVTSCADKSSGRLIGATLIGKDGAVHRGNVLAAMIQMGATLKDISHLDMMYAPPFSPLWDPVIVAANQTLKKL
jgi:NADPH-dependent 2,4-dienoyl-CoA reductase/sulfur reductase-like enzyme